MADQLKDVRPYMALSDSFDDSNPLFSYYLRKYSIQKAHQIMTTLKTTNPPAMENVKGQLTQWINKAEQSSNQLVGQIDLASNMAEMLDYTDRVFLAADNDYRAKNFTPELTQNMMTAWRFYEVINHFTPLSEDQVKRMKYAKIKTVEVFKTLKQMQSNPQPPEPAYKPEPPVFTPQPPSSNVTQPTFNNDFGQMQAPTFPQMQPPSFPQMQPPNFSPFAPPAFSNDQGPSFQPSPYPDFFGAPASNHTQPTAPVTQPTMPAVNPMNMPATQAKKDKKRMDPERIAAQSQAISQLQNAISELSFNRVGYAKQAIRNAAKLLERYD